MIILIRFINATKNEFVNTIGIQIPSVAKENTGILYRIIYSVLLCFFIIFIMRRKSLFIGLQQQAIILQGMFFGIEVVLESFGIKWFGLFYWLIAIITAPVCAIISVNDKFLRIFLCMVNSFGICYLSAVIFRVSSTIKLGVLGIVLYLLLILLYNGTAKAQLCFAKTFTVTISVLSIIQMTNLINIFKGIHGTSQESVVKKIIYFGISGVVLSIVGIYFVSFTFYSDWAEEKANKIETATKNAVKKETPASA
ncbi:putative SP-containing membrane protein [Vairimorpha necatrix]|uniref:SP-containing membrane protein n=1 Tax=Vairimorpha necatrix TaxID=6039 RepID=A0AAX4J7Z7_9MICR